MHSLCLVLNRIGGRNSIVLFFLYFNHSSKIQPEPWMCRKCIIDVSGRAGHSTATDSLHGLVVVLRIILHLQQKKEEKKEKEKEKKKKLQ